MKCAILLPVYNNAPTLKRTFESLANQTYQDFRIIAINDGSTDDTSDLFRKWQQRFGRERLVIITNEKNIGLTRALNLGLGQITEPYTARIDADDWWHPEKLKQQIAYLDTHPACGIVGTWYENHGRHGIREIRLPETDTIIRASIFKQNPFAHSAVVFRTDLVKRAGGYDDKWRYGQDYELWLRLMPKTRFANIPRFLCYRSADDTLTARKQRDQMLLCVRTQLRYLKAYGRPWHEYRFILGPLLVALAPEWLRTLKRRFL